MKKTLLICALAACVAGCVEQQRRDEYAMGYEFVPAYTTGCSTCAQPVTTCNTCNTCLRPVLHQQPKQVVVVMPAPQPVVEHEIVYEPQPTCGCSTCNCGKKKASK
ncbi:MAG: hypothetical protein II938_00120 [Alphaproteobacteria bacterium]|nr:hypothetical protein [Alphaproteobacteria bacterium]